MRARRIQHGTGTVRQLPSGHWQAKYRIGNGYMSLGTYATEEDAESAVIEHADYRDRELAERMSRLADGETLPVPPPLQRVRAAGKGDRLRTYTLYRLRDSLGRLLYIGISNSAARRFEEHASERPWWTQVAAIEVQHYATRAEVEAAEKAAIRDEQPLYNKAHNAAEVPL